MLKHASLKLSAVVIFSGTVAFAGCAAPPDDEADENPPPTRPEATVTETQTVTESPQQTEPAPPEPTPDESLEADRPTNAVDYTDALVIAWGAGDESTMQDLAQPEVIQTLQEYGVPGGDNWKRTTSNSGAGSTFVTYENTYDGTTIEVRVTNAEASRGAPNAVAEAQFTR